MIKCLFDDRVCEGYFPKTQMAYVKISNKSTVSKMIEVVKFIILMPWLLINDSASHLSKLIRRDVKKVSIMDKFLDASYLAKLKMLNAFKISKDLAIKHQPKIIKTALVGTFLLGGVYSSPSLQELFGVSQNRQWFNSIDKSHALIFSLVSIFSVIGWKWLSSDFRLKENSVGRLETSAEQSNQLKESTALNGLEGSSEEAQMPDQASKKLTEIEIQVDEGNATQERARIDSQMFGQVNKKFTEMYDDYLESSEDIEKLANLFNYSKNNLNLDIKSEHHRSQLENKHKMIQEEVKRIAITKNFLALMAFNEGKYNLAIELSEKIISLINKLSLAVEDGIYESFNSRLADATERIRLAKNAAQELGRKDDEKTKEE